MKVTKISIVIGIISVGWIIASLEEPSQTLTGITIGVMGLIFAYIYNWMKHIDSRISFLHERVDNIHQKQEWGK